MTDMINISDIKMLNEHALQVASYHNFGPNHTDAGWFDDTVDGILGACFGEQRRKKRQIINEMPPSHTPLSISHPPSSLSRHPNVTENMHLVFGFVDPSKDVYFVIDKEHWERKKEVIFPIKTIHQDENLHDLENAFKAYYDLIHRCIKKNPNSGRDYLVSFYKIQDLEGVLDIFKTSFRSSNFMCLKMSHLGKVYSHLIPTEKFQKESGEMFIQARGIVNHWLSQQQQHKHLLHPNKGLFVGR
jgi:hypothetical protein